MVANLFGDFVKGRNYSYLPQIVQEGVFLHRQIDDFIDHHPLITELRLHLYHELPKIAGIAIDLYFDHLLAKNWPKYHPKSLDEFIDLFLEYTEDPNHLRYKNPKFEYPIYFNSLLLMIKNHNLLKKNLHLDGLRIASEGLSQRIAFKNNLNIAAEVFINNEQRIEKVFHLFMADAILHFKSL
uniref:ACP phosphodiesterase n=1 Tax=Brumimicrobium mesophilum TaxID=392717 RepID=UPI000D140EA1|nr:ACP phosphodiesterase [Brumimicrobium mesophilum]